MTVTDTVSDTQHRYSLLIVDDNADIRASLRRGLRNTEYAVIEAPDGDSGLEILQRMSVDVVISDFKMPGMDGVDFLRQVRIYSPQALRILLTGELDVQVAARALNEGAAHRFLLKPWDRVDLVGVIRLAQRMVVRAPTSMVQAGAKLE